MPAAPAPPASAAAADAAGEHGRDRHAHHDRAAARARALANKPLTGAEIQAAVASHQSSIVRCLRAMGAADRPAQVAAKVTIETSGQISEVHLDPKLPDPHGPCLEKAMRAIHLRRHPTEGLEVTIPLRLQAQ